jgi:membrane protein involved in colicin uptake
MTWVKKTNPEWFPQEFKNILVGDVVDFPGNIEKLISEGLVVKCDEKGNDISDYEATGKITEREHREFVEYVEMKKQERLKLSLEKEIGDTKKAIEDAKEIKAKAIDTVKVETVDDAKVALEAKRKAFGEKMAKARAEAKAKKATAATVEL